MKLAIGLAALWLGGALCGFSARGMVESPAVQARLIGECDGRIMAAMEEDQFPAGCDWIEPIRYLEDGGPTWRAEHGRALKLESR